MGWLPFSSSSPKPTNGPAPSSDGGFIAPDRNERALCWEARDAFYACLDRNEIIDPITNAKQATEACGVQERGFEMNCARSWVKYFKQKRLADWKKEQIIKEIESRGGDIPDNVAKARAAAR